MVLPRASVIEGGVLHDHKGVAFPGSVVDVPAVSEKDVADLAFGRTLGVDYVAASFVSSGLDVKRVKNLVPGTPVIAKIESVVGHQNLTDILTEAAGTMVARGDLGVELSFEAVPRAQREILHRSNAKAKISITATEMLESMNYSTRPTRAEVSETRDRLSDRADDVDGVTTGEQKERTEWHRVARSEDPNNCGNPPHRLVVGNRCR